MGICTRPSLRSENKHSKIRLLHEFQKIHSEELSQRLNQIFVVHFFQSVCAVVRDKIDGAEEDAARTIVSRHFFVAAGAEYSPADYLDCLLYLWPVSVCFAFLLRHLSLEGRLAGGLIIIMRF
jgi:hypothetical protein